MRLAPVVILAIVSSLSPAQADGWVPPVHGRRGGNNPFAMPGNWAIGRLQMILDQADLPAGFGPGRLLTKIAYRRSSYWGNLDITYAAKTLVMEVAAGNSPVPGSAITATWATNRPADFSIVLPLGNVNLPADPPIGAFREVGPDIMIFPFTTPKVFTGPHLFIEHVNNTPSSSNTTYWADALDNRLSAAGGHNAHRGQFGCGAVQPSPTTLRAPSGVSGNALNTATPYTLANATANTAFLLGIGFELDNPYGLPAPFDLAPIGAPLCPFWNTLDVISIGSTSVAGGGTMSVFWPNDPSLAGLLVGIQAIVVSSGHNAAGLTTSNGISAWIGGRYPSSCGIATQLGNLSSLMAPANGVYVGAAQITHLFWL